MTVHCTSVHGLVLLLLTALVSILVCLPEYSQMKSLHVMKVILIHEPDLVSKYHFMDILTQKSTFAQKHIHTQFYKFIVVHGNPTHLRSQSHVLCAYFRTEHQKGIPPLVHEEMVFLNFSPKNRSFCFKEKK